MENQKLEPRYCLYARKSSESDERQSLSIESQINEMQKIAARDGLKITEVFRESFSAKKCGQREVFQQMIGLIERGSASGIITWSADRLSRNAGDLGLLVDLMDEGRLKSIVTYSQTFTDNPNQKFLLMILISQAKLENDNRSLNIRRGKRNQYQQGYWSGPTPLGYKSETLDRVRNITIDSCWGPVIRQVFQKVADGTPVKEVINWVRTRTSLRSKNGRPVPSSVIYAMLRRQFYIGKFSINGIEYRGVQPELISDELFARVQNQLRPFRHTYPRNDDYSLSRYVKCPNCGSGMHRKTGKRKLKDGRIRTHIYYVCIRNCSRSCVHEEQVLKQVAETIEKMDVSEIEFPKQIQDEIVIFERIRWDVYFRMSGKPVTQSVYPYEFNRIDQNTIRMYLQNAILYSSPQKRSELISMLKI